MWNDHWCKSDVTRIREIAAPMNDTLTAARTLGIHVIFAPSDVTGYYSNSAVRHRKPRYLLTHTCSRACLGSVCAGVWCVHTN
jgi:hypothetical protein